jgi:hypothetical protein
LATLASVAVILLFLPACRTSNGQAADPGRNRAEHDWYVIPTFVPLRTSIVAEVEERSIGLVGQDTTALVRIRVFDSALPLPADSLTIVSGREVRLVGTFGESEIVIAEWQPQPGRLVAIFISGTDKAEAESIIAGLKIVGPVEWAGFIDDLN